MTVSSTKTSLPHSPQSPPSVSGHWLLGSLPEFIEDTLGFLLRVPAEHGPIVRIRLLRGINYLISDPELIAEVLLHQQSLFIKNTGFWQRFYGIFGRGLITNEGESWKTHRKLVAPAFQPKRLARYVDHMVQYSERMLQEWQTGEVRDVHHDMMRLTAEIITRALFDTEYSDESGALRGALHELEAQIAVRMMRPFQFLDRLPLASNRRYWRTLRTIRRQVNGFVEQHEQHPARSDSLLSLLMSARYEDGTPISRRQLRDETVTLFLAGHDTTAITLSWAFYLLSQHPQYWELLREEWSTAVGERAPVWEDLPRLPLTRSVIRETLRLYPPAFVIGREPLEDVVVGGYNIPQSVGVIISPYVMGRNSRYFPEPERFNPQRWTPDFELSLPRFAFIPFGGGPRTCIGEGFAMAETMLLLLLIGRRFTLQYTGAKPPVPLPSITLPPRDGVKMRVEIIGE